MCLIFFAWKTHPEYRLLLAANRDEFYERPTSPLSFWEDDPRLLAGRDLKGRGTWLGITKQGRFAAITNYRDPASVKPEAPSRGLLLTSYLKGKQPPGPYLEQVQKKGHEYNGFNLLIGNPDELWYYSNRGQDIQCLPPGEYGLSNHLLDTPWPKIETGLKRFKHLLNNPADLEIEDMFGLLQDRTIPPDQDLPETGVGLEWERILAPAFITSPVYGTRSSSVLLMKKNGPVTFYERTFHPESGRLNPPESRSFNFRISDQ